MSFIRRNWAIFSMAALAAGAAVIVLTALYAPPTTQGNIPAPRPGFMAPAFVLDTLDGDQIHLSQYAGQPVILNLWASWCPPCRAEMPALESVYNEYKSQGLVVLGLNMTAQDDAATVAQFVEEYGLTFPIPMDLDGSVGQRYNLFSLPTTFFIRGDGIIHDVIVGGPQPEAVLRSKVLEMMEER